MEPLAMTLIDNSTKPRLTLTAKPPLSLQVYRKRLGLVETKPEARSVDAEKVRHPEPGHLSLTINPNFFATNRYQSPKPVVRHR
jgi:hypothetical protein